MATGDLKPQHPWLPIAESPNTLGRTLTRAEQLFCQFNSAFYGQNSPWIGGSISISIQNVAGHSHLHNLAERDLLDLATKAWIHTRWVYPMIACRLQDAEKMLYRVEGDEEVKEWAGRTVKALRQEGGWSALRDRLSETADLPTGDGDCCLLYVVADPSDSDSVMGMQRFDVLIHFHHALTDGTGMRTILNEVLTQMAKMMEKDGEDAQMMWGGEVERLYPAVLDLATEREREAFEGGRDVIPSGSILPARENPVGKISRGAKGSRISTHTFPNPSFLPNLLSVCRNNKIKLTALMQATLVAALYEFSPTKPLAEENFILPSAIDLRNGRIIPPYTDRNVYVFNSTVLQLIKGTWDLFQGEESRNERVLKIARHFATQWAELAFGTVVAKSDDTVREMGRMMLEKTEGVTEEIPSLTIHDLYSVADPPGSNQLSSRYEIDGGGHFLDLEHYQIATSQNTSKVSCRFHSWNERLTVCLVYNTVGRSKETMAAFLAKWTELIENFAASSPEGLGMDGGIDDG